MLVLLSVQSVWGQTRPNIPGKALLPAANLLTSEEVETRGVPGDCLIYRGFQPSGLSASKTGALGLLHPAQLEVTLALHC